MAGTFAPSASLRGLAWGIDGVGLVMAGAVLTLVFYRRGQDLAKRSWILVDNPARLYAFRETYRLHRCRLLA
jgi:hypothetical protein